MRKTTIALHLFDGMREMMISRLGLRCLAVLGVFFAAGSAFASGSSLNFTYQGRAFQSDGATPLTSTGVTFKLGIYSHDGNCLLYEEQHTSVNLSTTNGLFSLQVGGGVSTVNTPMGQTMLKVFANGSAIDVAANSQGACGAQTYTPTANQIRKLKVTIVDGTTTIVLSPMQEIVSTPYAMVAETLQGKSASSFVQITSSITQGDFEAMMAKNAELLGLSSKYMELLDLANGVSTLYVKSGAALTSNLNLGSQRITNVGTPADSTDAVNKSYADSRVGGMSVDSTVAALGSGAADNGKVLTWDSANQKWIARSPGASAVSNVSGIGAISVTNGSTTPSIAIADASTSSKGAMQVGTGLGVSSGTVSVNFGTVAGTAAQGNDARITGALQSSGGTMSGNLNMGLNNITSVGNMPFSAAAPTASENGKTLVFTWHGSLAASNWSWVTPAAAGSGLTSFNGATGTSQSLAAGTSGTAPSWSTASNTHTLNIPMASTASVTAGLISNTQYSSFNNKFDPSSGGTITGNVTFSGTVALPAHTVSGALNMSSHQINGVTDPTLAQDAATKHYADTHIGGGTFSTALTGNAGKVLTVNGTSDGFILATPAVGTITGVTTGTAATTGLSGGGTSGTLSLSVNLGTGANQVPQLDASGKLVTGVLPSHSASLITSGALAVAQGGTGAATTSAAAQFFAGPTGASGAPSFRTIASTDLPSGTLSGSGTAGYLPYYSAGSTLANSAIYTTGGKVGIGTTGPANLLSVGSSGNTGQTSASIQARNQGNSFEWGHNNPAGYASTLGANAGSGQPFMCLNCEAGTTSNTFKTRGKVGTLLTTDNGGSFIFGRVPTASADDQTPQESMRINSSGNVGIGTTNPQGTLDINGSLCIKGNCKSTWDQVAGGQPVANIINFGGSGDGATDNVTAFNNALNYCYTNNIHSIYFPSGVYVFLSKPSDISGAVSLIGDGVRLSILVRKYSPSTSTEPFIQFNRPAGAGFGTQQIGIHAGAGTSGGVGLQFVAPAATGGPDFSYIRETEVTYDSGASWGQNAVVFDGSLRNSGGANGLRDLKIDGLQIFGNLQLKSVVNAGISRLYVNNLSITGVSGNSSTDINIQAFAINNTSIDNAAYVHINTAYHNGGSPAIYVDSTASSITLISGSGIPYSNITNNSLSTTILNGQMMTVGNTLKVNTGANKLSVAGNILTSGNVGVGLTNPTYQLQLSTDSAAKPGTSTWTIASDARLKDIRAPFERGLDALEGIDPIYFRYKQDNPLGLPSDKEYVGIIAQDAQKAVPEAVQTDEQGYFHVTNDAIIWTILNSVKELYHKVMKRFDSQDRSIASVKAEAARANVKVAKLEADNSDKDREIKDLKAKAAKSEQENATIKAYLCGKDPSADFCH